MCGRIKDLIIVRGRNHYPQVRQSMHGTHAHALHTHTPLSTHTHMAPTDRTSSALRNAPPQSCGR